MRAFILALLPGLEEETGEFFEKASTLMRSTVVKLKLDIRS